MPFQGDELYRTKEQILASFIAAYQARIPDVWLGEDGTLRIMLEIDSGQIEGLYLSNQILLEDMFPQTASYAALLRHGETYGLQFLLGTPAVGQVLFSGQGGVYIPTGTEVGFDPGGGQDVLYFVTTQDGTTPNPGTPPAMVVSDGGTSGTPLVPPGTYEYVVTFVTAAGEGLPSAPSNFVTWGGANHSVYVNPPLGGPGTIARKIYRSSGGGPFQLVTTINNNVDTFWDDNIPAPSGTVPPLVDTSIAILLNATSEENGVVYNTVPGAISILVSVPDGITSVTNPTVFSGGSDEEDIEHFRTRLLNWIRSPQTGSTQDLVNWAETVAGVDTATAFNNVDLANAAAPGTVTIRIVGPGGTVPSGATVTAVQTLLNGLDLANVTVLVGTFGVTAENVTVTIFPATGYTTAGLSPSVKQAMADYINSVPVGGTMYLSGIIDAVYGLPGVNDVIVTAPATNQTAGATSKFTPGVLDVNGTP